MGNGHAGKPRRGAADRNSRTVADRSSRYFIRELVRSGYSKPASFGLGAAQMYDVAPAGILTASPEYAGFCCAAAPIRRPELPSAVTNETPGKPDIPQAAFEVLVKSTG